MSYTNEQIEMAQKLLDTKKVRLLEIISKLQTEVEALRKDAERYKKHCRNAQVAAWCGIDPYTPDVLEQLDSYIDAAIAGEAT
jgi:hypothetical protein